MIRTVALALPLALLLIASARANDPWKPGTFRTFMTFDEMPRTTEDATKKSWEVVDGPTIPSCYDDFIMMIQPTSTIPTGLYYDSNGKLAGIMNALPASCTPLAYDLVQQGLRIWVYNGVTYYVHVVFLVPQDTASRTFDANEIVQGDFIWYEGNNYVMKSAPRDHTVIKNDDTNIWKKQACIIWMGLHYYSNMTTSTSCDSAFEPIFLLYDSKTNQLIGFGFMVPGCTCTGNPLENPKRSDVEMIVPDGPQCLYELVEKHKVCTVHFYFVDNPRLIFC